MSMPGRSAHGSVPTCDALAVARQLGQDAALCCAVYLNSGVHAACCHDALILWRQVNGSDAALHHAGTP